MLRVTALRTATLLLDFDGVTFLTDPWFGTRMWWVLPTWKKPAIPVESLPRVDAVLDTHLHPDHYDRDAVRTLFRRADRPDAFIGPPGTKPFLPHEAAPFLRELAPGDVFDFKGLRITATRCVHTGPPPAEVNYIVEGGGLTAFFAGDSRYSTVFAELGRRYRIDVAFLPVSGTEVFGHRTTMNEEDAAVAASDLRARLVVPMHEGGVWLSVPPASRHPGRESRLAEVAKKRGSPFEVRLAEPGVPLELR